MGKYEKTMEAILREHFENAKFVEKKGDDGFEYELNCHGCEYFCITSEYIPHPDIRKANGGSGAGGKCFEFYSLDKFWDSVSNTIAIDPETGELISFQ